VAIDRTVRCLSSLGAASSSRVLNLAAIALENAETPGHRTSPFFDSPVINGSIILKHRLRADEIDSFANRRAVATKVIIPFEKTDLRAGGRSFFIGQRGYEEMLREVGNYGHKLDIKRDLEVMRLLDTIPSLDPFLLREHLRGSEIAPDGCYFAISAADQQRMFEYAANEVRRLTSLAIGDKRSAKDNSTGKIVLALLSSEVNERLEPLRNTLRLAADEFVEGIFSWRGFLYYKWSLEEFWPHIIKVLRDMQTVRPIGKIDSAQASYLANIRRTLVLGVKANSESVRQVLGIYDDAYSQLIECQDPKLFRDFLLNAPSMFLELGEKMGSMSHISSFWRYRFPEGAPKLADAEELMSIFLDFAQSFGLDTPGGDAWATRFAP
jgi:hypothetical protein